METKQVRRRATSEAHATEAPAEGAAPTLTGSLGNRDVQRAISGADVGGIGPIVRAVAGSGAPSNAAMLRAASEGVGGVDRARLDLAERTFTPVLPPSGGRVRMVGWSADGEHAAVLVESRPDRTGQRAPPVVEVRRSGAMRARIQAPEAVAVAVTADRVAVGGPGVQVWDLDGAPIGAPLAIGRVARLRTAGGEQVVALGFDGHARLVDAGSAAITATWTQPDLVDVGVWGDRWVGIDRSGAVHVGCQRGADVRTVSTASDGGEVLAVHGDRVATAGARGVRIGTLQGSCSAE